MLGSMEWALSALLLWGNVAGALVVPNERGGAWRVALALVLGACAVVAPALWPRDWPSTRTVFAFAAMAGFFRLIEIVRHRDTSAGARVASVVYPILSAPRLVRTSRSLRVDAIVVGVVFVAFAIALFFMAGTFPPARPYSGVDSMMRTLVGGASAYFIVDGTGRLSEAALAFAGWDSGPLHDAPILARTIAEFWNRRWNRAVHVWLDENAFRPTMRWVLRRAGGVRRGPSAVRVAMTAGVLAAFGVSAVLHFVPICVAYDGAYAVAMGAFFLLHGVLVVIETRLGVAKWPVAFAHAWTLGLFFVTAPLFVEPLLRSMGR